jgi:cyclopropane-fatty-acyl-phospholipid synthase
MTTDMTTRTDAAEPEASVTAPALDRRTAIARAVVAILRRAIADPALLSIALDGAPPDDPALGGAARARVRIAGPDAVARLLWPPTPDTFAEGYLRGDLEIEGDVMSAVAAGQALDLRRLDARDFRRLLRWGLELRRGATAARPLTRSASLRGPLHSRARDMDAIRFHYDVGESFYSLWLDRRLTYSCAYFERPDDPAADLDTAQEAKLDLICRKLRLQAGQRLLDIGCGWGSLILFAADRYGVEAVGVTLSQRQADEANRRAAELGLADRVRADVRDYRDLAPLGPFDAIASVGMFEHVGERNLPEYFKAAFASLEPGGYFLNHGIAQGRNPGGTLGPDLRPSASHFVARYVFPDGELVPVERAIDIAKSAGGFELLDIQQLRPHYALTLAAWVARLEAHWDEALAAAGEEVARTWRLYMSASRHGFEAGEIEVAQLLLARPVDGGPAPRPLRSWW